MYCQSTIFKVESWLLPSLIDQAPRYFLFCSRRGRFIKLDRLRNEFSELLIHSPNNTERRNLLESLNRNNEVENNTDKSTRQIKRKSQSLLSSTDPPAIVSNYLVNRGVDLVPADVYAGAKLSRKDLEKRAQLKNASSSRPAKGLRIAPLSARSVALAKALGFEASDDDQGQSNLSETAALSSYEKEKHRRYTGMQMQVYNAMVEPHDTRQRIRVQSIKQSRRHPKNGPATPWAAERSCPVARDERLKQLKKLPPKIRKFNYNPNDIVSYIIIVFIASAINSFDRFTNFNCLPSPIQMSLRLSALQPRLLQLAAGGIPELMQLVVHLQEKQLLIEPTTFNKQLPLLSKTQNIINQYFSKLFRKDQEGSLESRCTSKKNFEAIYVFCRDNSSVVNRFVRLTEALNHLSKDFLNPSQTMLFNDFVDVITNQLLPRFLSSELISMLVEQIRLTPTTTEQKELTDTQIQLMCFGKSDACSHDPLQPYQRNKTGTDWTAEGFSQVTQGLLPTLVTHQTSRGTLRFLDDAEVPLFGVKLILSELAVEDRCFQMQIEDALRLLKWISSTNLMNSSITKKQTEPICNVLRQSSPDRFLSLSSMDLKVWDEEFENTILLLLTRVLRTVTITKFQEALNCRTLMSLLMTIEKLGLTRQQHRKQINPSVSGITKDVINVHKAVTECVQALGDSAVRLAPHLPVSELISTVCLCISINCPEAILENLTSILYSSLLSAKLYGRLEYQVNQLPKNSQDQSFSSLKSSSDPEPMTIDPAGNLTPEPKMNDIMLLLYTFKKSNIRHPVISNLLFDILCDRFDAHLLSPSDVFNSVALSVALTHSHPAFLLRGVRHLAAFHHLFQSTQVQLLTASFQSLRAPVSSHTDNRLLPESNTIAISS